MKRLSLIIILLLTLMLNSCGDISDVKSPDSNTKNILGTTETFTWDEFTLEISNVASIHTEEMLAEGIWPYEKTTFTCYPGATLTVVNADMESNSEGAHAKTYPRWGIYDFETDQRLKLTDDTEPILLDDTTDCVYDLESSVVVLSFEFIE